MAQHMFDTQTVNTTGAKPLVTLTKFPEFGATASVGLTGVGGSATVQLRGWVAGSAFKEVLAVFTLPVPSGAKAGDMFDSAVVASQWEGVDWNVVTLSAGAQVTLALSGAGI